MSNYFIHEPSTPEEFLSALGGKDNIQIVRTNYGDVRTIIKVPSDINLPPLSTDFDTLIPGSRVWFIDPSIIPEYFFFSDDPAIYEPLLSFLGPDLVEEPRNVIRLGRYEQGSGIEPIEWMVLDRVQDGSKTKLLVVSLYALEQRQYNKFEFRTTWENSPLRQWLNKDFLEAAFSPEERGSILLTDVKADNAPRNYYCEPSGNDTQDRIFLLSISEVQRYFPRATDALCLPTKVQSRPKGEFTELYCNWWLRTTGAAPYKAARFTHWATFDVDTSISNKYTFVRPAMWIEL